MARGPLQPGTMVDGYRLDERIHRSSMSAIWRVTRPGADGPPLAMKIPLLEDYETPAPIIGFEVESMILPTLSGPHVPRFVAAADFSSQPYLVMEFLEGPSLRARLERLPLEPAEVAAIGARVATALHDVHRQGVIHLDVKPSNVLFRPTGEAVLIDFGLARHDRLPDLHAEELRVPVGTGPYISPEQVRRTRNDPRSDLFALGVVLYHLSTGRRPFGNPTTMHGLRRRLYRDPAPPRSLDPAYPPWLQEIVLRCLEMDSAARYETAAQLAFELQHPDRVRRTARAERVSRDSLWTVGRRYFRSLGAEPDLRQSAAGQLSRAPIVVVAIDLAQGSEALDDALRQAARRILEAGPGARLACVTVLKTSILGMDEPLDEQGRNRHVQGLIELEHWARPLRLPPGRVTYHVLEAPDPGSAILDFVNASNADQILIGSRGSSTLRRYLGSVSSQVVASAECTVTVVKARTDDAPDRGIEKKDASTT